MEKMSTRVSVVAGRIGVTVNRLLGERRVKAKADGLDVNHE